MSISATTGQNTLFKTGWIVLLVLAALMSVGHSSGVFVRNEPDLFLGLTAFNLYSLVVIAIPFRRQERWAWYTTWILPVGTAAVAFTDAAIAPYYLGLAAACAVGLLLTIQGFFALNRPAVYGK